MVKKYKRLHSFYLHYNNTTWRVTNMDDKIINKDKTLWFLFIKIMKSCLYYL
jgi:hypothetical protein